MNKYTRLLPGLLLAFSSYSFAEKVEIKHNDLTLNANLEMADDKKLEDGVILMTHGTMAHSGHSIMSEFQELLAENGINSLAINLGLGMDNRSGMYDCTKPHNHKHSDALTEIGLWKDWLKKKGTNNITLLGHSRGGSQTSWFASENNDDEAIKKIILVAPATWNADKDAKEYEEKYGAPVKPILEKAQALVKDGKGDQMLEKTDFIYCEDATVNAASFAAYYTPNDNFHTPNTLAKIKKPVLVIAGSEDDVVEDLIGFVEPLAKEDNISLFVVDGAGHMFRDIYGEEVVDQIIEFMGE